MTNFKSLKLYSLLIKGKQFFRIKLKNLQIFNFKYEGVRLTNQVWIIDEKQQQRKESLWSLESAGQPSCLTSHLTP